MGSKRTVIRSACFAVLAILFGTTNGYACSRDPSLPEPTTEDLYSQAASVFVAHLTKTEETGQASERKIGMIEGTFRVIEVLKGQPPADGKIRSDVFLPGNCTIPLLSGMDYIFYVDNNKNYITWITGSAALWNINASGAQQLLKKLRSLPK